MNIEKGKISGLQLTFLIAGLIQGSVLTTSYTTQVTNKDSWIVVLTATIVVIPLIIIYVSISTRFPDKNIIKIHDIVYGKYIGKFISAFYVGYFLIVLSFNIRSLGDFYTTFLMTDTPLEFFLIIFTLVCAFAIWKGIEVVARISPIFVVIGYFIIVSTFLLLTKDMKFSNFLPIFDTTIKDLIQGTHIIVAIPFGEVVIFLTIFNTINERKGTLKYSLWGLALGVLSLLIVTIRNTAVLGNTELILMNPSFQSARLIDVGKIFTRMDIFIGIGITVMLFIKCSLFYYATVISLSQLFSLKEYKPLILPLGGIALILGILNWESSVVVEKLAPNTSPIFVTPFIFIIPPLTLLISKVRDMNK